ncbi:MULTISPECIES: hypothetical protein [Flavobacterium]|uniref:hypothetical protein n=1 Tax=Flavobacterium TaxID=237 RepID=UPI001FCB6C4D|nr:MULTISPECIES: hypothetical protein [Flavobacterium]UOK42179.1 hypothetical protein LZF87_12775 [Flavobacterium enshiense]
MVWEQKSPTPQSRRDVSSNFKKQKRKNFKAKALKFPKMKKTIFILFFLSNVIYSQNKQCFITYKTVEKIFKLNSLEEKDDELIKLNFKHNSSLNYFNEKAKSNITILTNKTNKPSGLRMDFSEICYNSFKKDIIALGFIKINESFSDSRIDFHYKKGNIYIIFGKMKDVYAISTGKSSKTFYGFDILTEDLYLEFTKY